MNTDQIQMLNYCAHAIEDLGVYETMLRRGAPESARVVGRLIDMLRHSVKFILPNCCNLVDPESLGQSHLDLVRLPYPCVAFEAPWEKEDGLLTPICGFDQTPATKRIALCWEALPEYDLLPGLYSILDTFPEGGVFIVPIYWVREFKRWTVSPGGCFHPHANVVQKISMENSLPVSRIANQAAIDAGLAKEDGMQFRSEPFALLPEPFADVIAQIGRDRAYAQIHLDSRDENFMLIQACSVINCNNVTTVDIEAPAALNKKRQARGNQAFFSYKVLQLAEDKRAPSGNVLGGHHAGPRMHLRRGHLRRLDHKTVWVRATMVKSDSPRGVVLKDYAVE